MAVGRVGGGGRKGSAGSAKGAGPAAKSGSPSFAGKIAKTESLVGPSGAVGSASVSALDQLTSQALDIARLLKAGEIKTKQEATKKLVANILKEKVRMQSKALTQKIAEVLEEDPRLQSALDRIWAKAK